MAAIRIRALPEGSMGPLWGAFTVESADGDFDGTVAASVIALGRWVIGGMSAYRSKGGVEESSLFKSYTMECFEGLRTQAPEAAAHLSDLVVICDALSDELDAMRCGASAAPSWRRCRTSGSSNDTHLAGSEDHREGLATHARCICNNITQLLFGAPA
jgi:hypothetical protein